MGEWTQEERAALRARWVGRDTPRLALPGACPHCLHDDAFKGIVVYREMFGPAGAAGGLGNASPMIVVDERTEGTWPDSWPVDCKCGDKSHGDGAEGCGRLGSVDI